MHRFPLYMPVLVLFASTATAQVTVDMHALDQLQGGPSQGGNQGQPPAASKQKGAAHQPARKEAPAKAAPKTAAGTSAAAPKGTAANTETGRKPPVTPAKPPGSPSGSPPVAGDSAQPAQGAPAAAPPPAAALPSEPPPNVSLSPLEPGTPAAKPASPPAGVVAADAGGAATPIDDGLRITFGSGRPELSPATESALKAFVGKAPQGDNTSINVLAFAAGTADDPSTARRLSLSRALAVRSVLMNEGIPSAKIYLRALGTGSQVASQVASQEASSSEAPPDRVDVTVLGGNAQRTTAGAAP